jgi:hypothetical protein
VFLVQVVQEQLMLLITWLSLAVEQVVQDTLVVEVEQVVLEFQIVQQEQVYPHQRCHL